MFNRIQPWVLGLTASFIAAGSSTAAVIAIDSATFSGAAQDEVITSFVAGANSSGTNSLAGGTVVNADAGDEYYFGTTDPGGENAALSGLAVTTGTLNTSEGTDFQLGSIGAGDVMFLLEYDFSGSGNGADDDIVLAIIDSSGDVVGDYQLTINNIGTGGANLLLPGSLNRESGSSFSGEWLRGVSFLFDDFSGTTGDLSTATGLTVLDQPTTAKTDIAAIGVVVPEPASFALLSMAAGICLLPGRSRK